MLIFHTKHDRNRVTIAGDLVDGVLQLSAARCSKKDCFKRKVGNAIATGRFRAGKFCKSINVGSNFTGKDFVEIAAEYGDEVHKIGKLVCP